MIYDDLLKYLCEITAKRVYRSRYFCLGAILCSQEGGMINEREAEQLKRYFDCWDL